MRTENEVFDEWRAAKGDQRELLLQELVPLLQKHARAVIWNKLAESRPELVNQAIYKVVVHAEDFRGEAKFSSWFHTIITNECNLALKQEKRHRNRTVALEEDHDFPTRGVLDAGIELEQAIEGLTASDLSFIEMKLLGWNEEEIAKRLGINTVTVRQRWMRIKARVRRKV